MLLLLFLFLGPPAVVQAQFNYTTNNGTITITGYTGPGGAVTIPNTITGLPVTAIDYGAFESNTNLTGITIPSSAPHPKEAALFIAFLLSPEGRAIMEANHHPMFEAPLGDGYANIPPELQSLSVPAEER